MPRDDWAKARAKDAVRRGREGNTTRKRKNIVRKGSLKATRIMQERLQTWDARLWFGKFKGCRLRECPKWYLDFLGTLTPTGERMTYLIEFVKKEKHPLGDNG